MPLYIVRGPATWGALIRARDLDHLYYLIDEVADPGTCAVSEYTGPVALEFQLPATVGLEAALGDAADEVVVDFECEPASIDLDELPSLAWFGETGSVMRSHLCQQLFPAVERLADSWADVREYGDTHVESDAQLSELRSAIAADVRDQLKAAQWRDAGLARSTTRSAPVQRDLRVTVPPEALERGGETHLRWAEAEWGPLEHDTRRLVERLCRCLDRGDVAQARELANRLRDAQPRSPLAT